MSIINNLIDDLVDEHEVFADALLVKHAAVITKDFHHSIKNIEDSTRLHIVLGGRNEEDAKLLGEEVVHAINILHMEKGTHKDKSCIINCCGSRCRLTKVGGGSPGQNFTLRKKISLVCLPRSNLTTQQ